MAGIERVSCRGDTCVALFRTSKGDTSVASTGMMEHIFPIQHSWIIPIAPLIGAVIAGFFGARWLKGASHWPIWIGVGISAVLSVWLMAVMVAHGNQDPAHGPGYVGVAKHYFNWITAGDPESAGQPG